jgi:nucleotide-binding universal stress UspA family protein
VRLVAWITEAGWEACVDAAKAYGATEVTLIHVADVELPGPRGRRHEQVMARMSALAGEAARALLDDAEERLTGGLATAADRVAAASRGEPYLKVRKLAAGGHAETVLMQAAEDADVLVVARDNRHPGPHSIGHAARFVVDHAPCTVVLAWPAPHEPG